MCCRSKQLDLLTTDLHSWQQKWSNYRISSNISQVTHPGSIELSNYPGTSGTDPSLHVVEIQPQSTSSIVVQNKRLT